MPIRQMAFFLGIVLVLLLVILELVRRRALRVEYSWLWIISCLTIIVLILRYDLLVVMTGVVGAVVPTSTLFFLCILYLVLLCLHYSIRISRMSHEIKDLAQEVALLRAELEERDRGPTGRPAGETAAE